MALMAAMQILNRMREQGQNQPGSGFQQQPTAQPAVDLTGADYPADDSAEKSIVAGKEDAADLAEKRAHRRATFGKMGSAIGRYMSNARPNPSSGFGGQ